MKKIINTSSAPEPIGPYSQAVQAGNFLFISGQIAIDPKTNELRIEDIETETKQVMENLKQVLLAGGFEFEHIIKSTIFLIDMKQFGQINAIYGSYFNLEFPARETVEVSGLPKGVHVEISVVAYKP
ncbi:MAG: endoribonuclease [Sphingobacteriales bacterium]|nr:endoribonuclease [Sphingobacteriales bacterium]